MPVASRFNLVIPVKGTNDVLVFNTLQGSAALVEDRIAGILTANLQPGGGSRQVFRRFGEDNGAPVNNSLLTLPGEDLERLAQIGAVVESPSCDDRAVQALLDRYWHERTLRLTLSYTSACQMRCSYCFQSGRDLAERHGSDLIDRTISFVETYLNEHAEINELYVLLFGGEPLTAVDVANTYIDRLGQLASRRGLAFRMGLTTNGLNLKRSLIQDWAKSGLDYVRVTLDGPPDLHDARRPLASGRGTFETIVGNLRDLANLNAIGLGVSINIDKDNVDHVGALLDVLTEAGLKEHLEIILEPTVPPVGACGSAENESGTLEPTAPVAASCGFAKTKRVLQSQRRLLRHRADRPRAAQVLPSKPWHQAVRMCLGCWPGRSIRLLNEVTVPRSLPDPTSLAISCSRIRLLLTGAGACSSARSPCWTRLTRSAACSPV